MLQQVTNAFAGISFVYALYRLFAIMRKWTNGKNTRRRIGHELKQEPEKDEIFKDVYFRNSAGLWIYMQKWIPDSSIKVKGVVFVAHGIGEHIGRYHYFGKELANAGYLVYGIDHQVSVDLALYYFSCGRVMDVVRVMSCLWKSFPIILRITLSLLPTRWQLRFKLVMKNNQSMFHHCRGFYLVIRW